MIKSYEDLTFTFEEIKKDLAELKNRPAQPIIQQVPIQTQIPQQIPQTQPQVPQQTISQTETLVSSQQSNITTAPTPTTPEPTSPSQITPPSQQPMPQPPAQPTIETPQQEPSPAVQVGSESIPEPVKPSSVQTPKIITPEIKEPIQSEVEVPKIEGTPIKQKEQLESLEGDIPPQTLIEMSFDSLAEQIQLNTPFFKIAEILDTTRDTLQQTLGWDPIIYQIGKEARSLRRTEGNIDEATINYLKQKLEEWKSKLLNKFSS